MILSNTNTQNVQNLSYNVQKILQPLYRHGTSENKSTNRKFIILRKQLQTFPLNALYLTNSNKKGTSHLITTCLTIFKRVETNNSRAAHKKFVHHL